MSALAVLDPCAAFVDVGSEKMHVSIGGGPPCVFGTVTSQLQALRDFLIEHQVRSVAMEEEEESLDCNDVNRIDRVIAIHIRRRQLAAC